MVTLRSQTEICLELFGISQNSLPALFPCKRTDILSGNVGNRTDGGEEAESVFIRDSAHCADMSRGRVTDRRSLKNARQEIEKHVQSWLKTAQQEKKRTEWR
nr:thymus-specific serine protease-like [Pseudochaenichthys georgianus]